MNPLLENNLISTKEASEVSGYHADYLARLCREKKIVGAQIGRSWFVSRDSLESFVEAAAERKRELAETLSREREQEYRIANAPQVGINVRFAEAGDHVVRRVKRAVGGFTRPVADSGISRYMGQASLATLTFLILAGGAYGAASGTVARITDQVIVSAYGAREQVLEGMTDAGQVASGERERIASIQNDAQSARIAFAGSTHAQGVEEAIAVLPVWMETAHAPIAIAYPHDLHPRRDDERALGSMTGAVAYTIHHPDMVLTSIAKGGARGYLSAGQGAYDNMETMLVAYERTLRRSGSVLLASGELVRDTAPGIPYALVSGQIALGNSVIDAAHAALGMTDRASGTVVEVAPRAAARSLAMLDRVGSVTGSGIAYGIEQLPAAYDRGLYAFALGAPRLAERVVASQIGLGTGLNAGVQASLKVQDSAVRTAVGNGRVGLAALSDTSRDLAAAGFAAPSSLTDVALGTAGKVALAIEQPAVASSALTQSGIETVRLLASPLMSLSIPSPLRDFMQGIARATYAMLDGVLVPLADLFGGSRLAIVPDGDVTNVRPGTDGSNGTDGTPGSGTTVNTYGDRYVTNVYPAPVTNIMGGASMAYVDESISALRALMYKNIGNVGGHGGGGSGGGNTNSISGGTVADSAISGGTIDGATITGGSVSTGLFTSATTTINGLLTVNGDTNITGTLTAGTLSVSSISFAGAIVGPYFTATSTLATSTFAGGLTAARVEAGEYLAGPYVLATSASATSAFAGNVTVAGNTVLANATSSALHTNLLGVSGQYFSSLLGSGLQNVGGALTLDRAGDWTGTFDGQQGIWYQDRANHTGTQLASTISDFNASVNSFVAASSTIPKTYSTNTFSALQTFTAGIATNAFTLGTDTFTSLLGNGLSNVGGSLSVSTSSLSSGFFQQGGNSFGARGVLGTNDSNALDIVTGGATRLTVDTTGFVGIGTTTPGRSLHVAGTIVVESLTAPANQKLSFLAPFSGGGMTLGMFSDDFSTATTFMRLLANGNVGIGATPSDARLDIASTTGSATIGATALKLRSLTSASDWNTATPWSELQFHSNDTTGIGNAVRAKIGSIFTNASGSLTDLAFFTSNASALTEAMRITSAGFVGIGTTTPAQTLSVGGNVIIGAPSAGGTNGTLTYGGITFNNAVTGSGNLVGSFAPAFTGTITGASMTLSGILQSPTVRGGLNNTSTLVLQGSTSASPTAGSSGIIFRYGTGGSLEAGRIDAATGYFGIGTTSPYAKLSIAGGTSGTLIGADAASGYTGNLLELKVASTTVFSVNQAGTITSSGPLTSTATSTATYFSASTLGFVGAPAFTFASDLNTGLWSSGADTLNVSTAGVERMRIDSSGNIGIGTTTPATMLAVSGVISAYSTGAGTLSQISARSSSYSTSFMSANMETHGASEAGNIFSSIPNANLADLYFTNTANALIYTNNSAPLILGTNNLERVRIDSSGNVGVGTSSPYAVLSVGGNTVIGAPTAGGTNGTLSVANLSSCGGIQTNAAGTMSCTSDARLKDIQGGFTAGLAALRQITPETYTWKQGSGLYDGGVSYSGFIAQNVGAAIPEAMNTGASGYKQINTTTILSAAINGIKELDLRTLSLAPSEENASAKALDVSADARIAGKLTVSLSGSFAGELEAAGVTTSGSVRAAAFLVPSADELPEETLTDGSADLYKMASYAINGLAAEGARTDLVIERLDSIDVRLAALEAEGSPAAQAISLATSTVKNVLQSFGIMIENGVAQFQTIVFRQLAVSTDSDGKSSAASESILEGNLVVEVENEFVLPTSKIFVTFTSPVQGAWYISEKKEGSFRVTLEQAQPADVTFDYFILQTEGQLASPSAGIQILPHTDPAPPVSDPVPSGEGTTTGTTTPSDTGSGDTEPPSIGLNGPAASEMAAGGSWSDPGAHASDTIDGDLTASITTEGTVDTATPGTYTVSYSVMDAAGNEAHVSRIVTVVGIPAPAPDPAPAPETVPAP